MDKPKKLSNSIENNSLTSLESVYNSIAEKNSSFEEALLLLQLRNWFIKIADFDPRSGTPLPIDFDSLSNKIRNQKLSNCSLILEDRLSRIIEHSGEALKSIIRKPHEKVLREHKKMPIYAVREIDNSTIRWLSTKPGNNLRQKLAGNPYLKAVNRRMCLDTTENRLLKALFIKLEQILLCKNKAVSEYSNDNDSELLFLIQNWLRKNETNEIKNWTNVPPNNTLLQDKNYRKIWDSWLDFQVLDENIQNDYKRIKQDFFTSLFWSIVATLGNQYQIRLLQQPCYFDYDNFDVFPELNICGLVFPNKHIINLQLLKKNKIQIEIDSKSVVIYGNDDCSINLILKNDKEKHFDFNIETFNSINKIILEYFLNNNYSFNKSYFDKSSCIHCSDAIIDLYSTRPNFCVDFGKVQKLPFRLIQQYWKNKEYGNVPIDCGFAKAIALNSNVTTISMFSLFSDVNNVYSGDAAKSFITKLHEYIKTKKLTYLVPDFINDFALKNIRANINFYFPDAEPLPRSIATVFAWQASKSFNESDFKCGNIVFVIENCKSGIFITPLVGVLNIELKEKIPESNGIFWERHPSTHIQGDSVLNITKNGLDKDSSPLSEEMSNLFDIDSLIDEIDSLSFVTSKNEWYNLPINTRDLFRNEAMNNSIQLDDLNQTKNKIPGKQINRKCFVLPIGDSFKQPTVKFLYKWLGSSWSQTKGVEILSQWQKKAGEIPFWRNHLPDLSFNNIPRRFKDGQGYWGDFDLVKNETITPIKGEKIKLSIDETFTLPAGKSHYQFPLIQDLSGQKTKYMAFLKSNIFPLKKDVECRLDLYYTYGADEPYELDFVPRNPLIAGFNSVRVEWREYKHEKIDNQIFPAFPKRHTWKDFEHFPKMDSLDTSNLLEWLDETLKYFNRYQMWIEEGTLKSDIVINLRKNIRFQVFTIWNQEHSLDELDIPSWFKNSVKNGINIALDSIANCNTPQDLKDELFFFLCCLHKDTPEQISKQLILDSKNKKLLRKHCRNIAFSIGAAELDWQKQLLENIINPVDDEKLTISITLEIMAIAFWRSKNLIHFLSETQINNILYKLYKSLEFDIDKITKAIITKHLELLLALLRTRDSQDEKIKKILSPEKKITKNFISIVDKIFLKIYNSNFDIQSRIKLEINKPEVFRNTPDLLYAIRMYLTGNTGANSIQITGIEES